jgi:hypothetical protein
MDGPFSSWVSSAAVSPVRPLPPRSQRDAAPARLARAALPAWLFSLLLHAGLLVSLGTITWTVHRAAPERDFSVGIMVRHNTPQGELFQAEDKTYPAPEKAAAAPLSFVPDAAPSGPAESLPQLPALDLSTIGISGSMPGHLGDLTALPQGTAATSALASTQFFGAQAWGTKFVYVIDRSGSMSEHDALGTAKRELLASLSKLPPTAEFQIIVYNLKPEVMPSGPGRARLVVASDASKRAAQHFLDTIAADSGTEHLPAVKLALGLNPDVILFLTDADDMTARDVKELSESNKNRTKIHTIEFGPGPNLDSRTALRELAEENGGTYRYVDVSQFDRAPGTGR